MSAKNEEEELDADEMSRCASCGIAENDDIKLRKCACYLAKYCGVKCQKEHRPKHKRECKKRVAELRDELLFKQPESSQFGDCPICCLPIPIPKSQDTVRSTRYSCCSKVVCDGCVYANDLREKEGRLPPTCPFCRHPTPKTEEERLLLKMKRVEAKDPGAMNSEGLRHYKAGNHARAIEYWEKAAGLGDIEAHYHLSNAYDGGAHGVESDMKKFTNHAEQAAIGGHTMARYNLAVKECQKGNIERGVKHWVIAANLGCDFSIKELKEEYARGVIIKEKYATALRAYQVAVNASKSAQRDAAHAARMRMMS